MNRITKAAVCIALLVSAGIVLAGPGHNKANNHHGADQTEDSMVMHHKQSEQGNHGGDHQYNSGHHGQTHHMDEGQHGVHGHHSEHHEKGHHVTKHHDGSKAGKPGKAHHVDRIVHVEASDQMRFEHEPLHVKPGETIRFVVHNKGKLEHEFALGTKQEHLLHGQMMMQHPGMHHEEGGAAITLQPGETKELIWTFNHAENVQVACNIPGHYSAGMHSPVMMKHH